MKSFFAHSVSRTEEILSQNSFASSECHVPEVLTHINLFERTVRFNTKSVAKLSYPGEVLPIMAYTVRLRPKRVPFQRFRYIKGKDFTS